MAQKELDKQEGDFVLPVVEFLKNEFGSRFVEGAMTFGELLFVTDDSAQTSLEKSAVLCNAVLRRFVRPMIESEITRSSHQAVNALRERLCEKLLHPDTIPELETLKVAEFSMAAGLVACIFDKSTYTSKIQIDMEQLHGQTANPFNPDVITVRFGMKHFGYTTFIGRTMLVENKAPAAATVAYDFVYAVSEQVMKDLFLHMQIGMWTCFCAIFFS